MAKNRSAVTCNGRPAFYASMYEDIHKCAMDLGWAVALHGSLASDMDIMVMPWTKEAMNFETLVEAIVSLFDANEMVRHRSIDYLSKPHGRIVATVPIWEDFYLDISTIDTRKPMERIVERIEALPTKKTSKMVESKETPEWFYEVVTGEYISKNDAIEIVREEMENERQHRKEMQ